MHKTDTHGSIGKEGGCLFSLSFSLPYLARYYRTDNEKKKIVPSLLFASRRKVAYLRTEYPSVQHNDLDKSDRPSQIRHL